MSEWINPESFINRELSWLNFNERVLYEAKEKSNPILERMKYLSIVTSNLEEFFMVRVAVLKRQNEAELVESLKDFQTPQEQLTLIRERVKKMHLDQYDLFTHEILEELKKQGISLLLKMEEISDLKEVLSPVFETQIKPLLTPLSIGPAHPFPSLISGRLYLSIGLTPLPTGSALEKSRLSFIEVPKANVFGRFFKCENAYIPLENIIKLFLDRIFMNYQATSAHVIRITRDADISIQEDGASDLLLEIESSIKKMHRRSVVKLEFESGIPEKILKVIMSKNTIQEEECYEVPGVLNLKDIMWFYEKSERDDLKFSPIHSIAPIEFKNKDIFSVLGESDRILFHPYHAYDPVIELLAKAAEDPNVLAIKQTLYRTSSDSAIIKALIRAAENGKHVSVVDELKARFDEKRNIEWARKLEDAGAHVTYGVEGLKTHAKALIIIRRENNSIKRYIHLGTGNYNEATAKLYADFSVFTCDDLLGEDISSLFNLLTGYSLASHWNHITVSPMDLRKKFLRLIERERENASKGLKAKMTAKLNSLSDLEIIEALYRASNAGVKIKLIVRGICSLVPGLKGLSENISVISVVGRYLEHSRVFSFYNAGEEEIYLSSADWMIRNLDRRVEILFPILDEKGKEFIKQILKLQFEDNVNAWELLPDKTYRLVLKKAERKDSFEETYQFIKKLESSKKESKGKTIEIRPIRSVENG